MFQNGAFLPLLSPLAGHSSKEHIPILKVGQAVWGIGVTSFEQVFSVVFCFSGGGKATRQASYYNCPHSWR